jgi:hypothetical protein
MSPKKRLVYTLVLLLSVLALRQVEADADPCTYESELPKCWNRLDNDDAFCHMLWGETSYPANNYCIYDSETGCFQDTNYNVQPTTCTMGFGGGGGGDACNSDGDCSGDLTCGWDTSVNWGKCHCGWYGQGRRTCDPYEDGY